MKTDSNTLLTALEEIATNVLEQAAKFKDCTDVVLNNKPSRESWSILECLEHLNRYSTFYLPQIEKALAVPARKASFSSGLLGNFLVKAVIPKQGGKKMKTFAEMDPAGRTISPSVLDDFIINQRQLINYIERAKTSDLNKPAVPVTFTRLVKLRTGDALRFMVYHNQRHVLQALRNIG